MVLQPHKWSGNKQHFLTFPKVMASKLFEWNLKFKLKYKVENTNQKHQETGIRRQCIMLFLVNELIAPLCYT